MNKSPIAYVAREQVAVKPHAADPAAEYENVDQDMTSQAPHDQYVYGLDNNTIWLVIHDALKDHPYYTSIRSFARTQNVWAAYLSLTIHNLGEYRNHMIFEEAEDNLNNVLYKEEKLKFTFEIFVEIHRSAHNNMLLVPDYVVPNPATIVRKLLPNTRSFNPTLSHQLQMLKPQQHSEMTLNKQWILCNQKLEQRWLRQVKNKEFLLWQEDEELEENMLAEDVVAVVIITKANGHTRVDAEDA